MVSLTLGIGGFLLYLLYDVNSFTYQLRLLHGAFALGTLLVKREFDPGFFYTFQTDHIRFTFPAPVKWTLDGEFGGAVDAVEIENKNKAVEILVP